MNFIMIINDDITIMNVFLIISHGIMVLESIFLSTIQNLYAQFVYFYDMGIY